MTLCALMTSLLCGGGDKPAVDFSMDPTKLHPLITTVFVFSYVWSVGGNLVEKSMDAFDSFCRELFSDNHEVKVRLSAASSSIHSCFLFACELILFCRFLVDLICTATMLIWRASALKHGKRPFHSLCIIQRFVCNLPSVLCDHCCLWLLYRLPSLISWCQPLIRRGLDSC